MKTIASALFLTLTVFAGRLFRVPELHVQQPGREDLSEQVRERPVGVQRPVRRGRGLRGGLREDREDLPEELSRDFDGGAREDVLAAAPSQEDASIAVRKPRRSSFVSASGSAW